MPDTPASAALAALDQRSREIFREIVEAYLETGEPVGSRTLSKRGAVSPRWACSMRPTPWPGASRRNWACASSSIPCSNSAT
jgi:hypothetical protein